MKRKLSKKQEYQTAKDYGGTVTPGSGNKWQRKNDVRLTDTSIECKITERGSFSLRLSDLERAEALALTENRDMRFKVSFVDSNKKWHSYVLMPEEDYLRDENMNANQTERESPGRMGQSQV